METDIKVGDVVVLMQISERLGSIPVSFNSRNFPENSCRGEVVRIGRKYIFIQGNEKTPWKVLPYSKGVEDFAAVPLDIAKVLYKESMTNHQSYRTVEFIEECVRNL